MTDFHYLKILNRRAARGSAGERLGYVELDKVKPLERKKTLCLKVSGVAKYYYTRITNPSRFSFNLTPEQTILCIIKKPSDLSRVTSGVILHTE